MPPKSKRQAHCQQIAYERRHVTIDTDDSDEEDVVEEERTTFTAKADPDALVLSGLMTGDGYQSMRLHCQMMNIQPPAESTFYRHQNEIIETVHNEVSSQVQSFAEKIEDGTTLSGDCGWIHPRNASAATYTIIDNSQNKVVGYKNISKSEHNVASNMMESYGLRESLKQLQPYINGKDISFAHDHDNKSRKILAEFKIPEKLDPIHCKREITRNLTKFFDLCARERQKDALAAVEEENHALSIREKLQKNRGRKKDGLTLTYFVSKYSNVADKIGAWCQFLAHEVDDPEQKQHMWLNSGQHFIGNHENCIHPSDYHPVKRGRPKIHVDEEKSFWEWKEAQEDPTLLEELEMYLERTTPLILSVGKISTQQNESLNSSIAKRRPKHKSFSASNGARAEIAIGIKNDPHFGSNLIKTICPEAVSDDSMDQIISDEEIRHESLVQRATAKERKKKNDLRQKHRLSSREKPGDYKDKSRPFSFE